MDSLQNKVVLIAGGSSGIGRAIGLALGKTGAKVAFAARSADKLASAVAELEAAGTEALAHAADLTDEAQVDAFFAAATERFGRVDLLINATGAFDGGPIEDLTLATWNKVIATNLTAPFLCTRAAMRIMKGQRSGRIINIGSISAKRVRPNTAPYCTSKFGIMGLTESTALEGREFGITCGCIHPGNVLVERRQDSGVHEDDEPMIDMDSIAALAVTFASLPPEANILEATILPRDQLFVGRG
jgi:NAD(P)-dependent dehydrogenase (short-subunit alcohol dehydrogenase family)